MIGINPGFRLVPKLWRAGAARVSFAVRDRYIAGGREAPGPGALGGSCGASGREHTAAPALRDRARRSEQGCESRQVAGIQLVRTGYPWDASISRNSAKAQVVARCVGNVPAYGGYLYEPVGQKQCREYIHSINGDHRANVSKLCCVLAPASLARPRSTVWKPAAGRERRKIGPVLPLAGS